MTLQLHISVPAWHTRAACAKTEDKEVFFPTGNSPNQRAAKRICERCPRSVRAQCLVEAMTRDEQFGVWGGLSRGERVRLAKKFKQEPPVSAKEAA
ncbi:WhiB family transcriptional regulator [Nocardia sp. NPDC051030]|uniref:WhiB family transcriptional regulator n=1 Tax=Nocardia sp. NPDC051030 TaxID=3155162 RepID=UPI00342134C0